MKVYICEKCGKEYTHKGNYMKHLKRKTPCNKNLINETEIIINNKNTIFKVPESKRPLIIC